MEICQIYPDRCLVPACFKWSSPTILDDAKPPMIAAYGVAIGGVGALPVPRSKKFFPKVPNSEKVGERDLSGLKRLSRDHLCYSMPRAPTSTPAPGKGRCLHVFLYPPPRMCLIQYSGIDYPHITWPHPKTKNPPKAPSYLGRQSAAPIPISIFLQS